jgi:TolB protein
VITSTTPDLGAAISPDGRQIAFSSGQSGDVQEIWISGVRGENARQLTHGIGHGQRSPDWSPDGGRVAFESRSEDGHFHIWIINADGTQARQLTTEAGDQNAPVWSRDGQSIFYTANAGSGRNVWRTNASGGPATQITHGGSGMRVCPSRDGRTLLYGAALHNAPLLVVPAAGGAPTQLLPCVQSDGLAVAASSIYYAACDS